MPNPITRTTAAAQQSTEIANGRSVVRRDVVEGFEGPAAVPFIRAALVEGVAHKDGDGERHILATLVGTTHTTLEAFG